jgi:hypothetical protein
MNSIETKVCFKCNRDLPRSEFYKHPQMGDGLLGKCKDCSKADVKANRLARLDQYSAYERERFKRPERKVQRAAAQRRHREKYPEKNKARAAVRQAIASGRLTKPDYCTVCGRGGDVEAHHTDYSRPLDVLWLCFVCHREYGHEQVVVARDWQRTSNT